MCITGEGGSGKTSLACQMALWAMAEEPEQRLCRTHRMLPVLLESNIEPRTDGKDGFLEAIRGRLADLVGEPEPIAEEVFLQLLRKRRVLILVDSFSELQEETRTQIRPVRADFAVAALVVTSRREEWTNEVTTTTIRTLRVQGDRLSAFMDSYLKQRGKRDLFNDPEYFAACSQLSLMVGTREITVLIAKMYAEQMIAGKEHPDQAQPTHLPDLMLGYLNTLNRSAAVHKPDNPTIQRIATTVAWECLKQAYCPAVAKRADVVMALRVEANAEALLRDLEERLQLVQTVGVRETQLRFTLDPLAEYLAGLYMIEHYGNHEYWWKEFLIRVQQQAVALTASRSFLRAVYDCSVAYASTYGVPQGIIDELARLAGLASSCQIEDGRGSFPEKEHTDVSVEPNRRT
jgi:NACHT domain